MSNPYAAQAYGFKTREEAVVEYAPLVKRLATHLAARLPEHLDVQDLIQAGMIGLLDAIEKYDSRHEAQFRTYAEFRIKGAMLDELRSTDWIPRSVRENAGKMSKAHRELTSQLGRMPTEEELAKQLGISLTEYHELLLKSRAIPLLNIEDLHGTQHEDAPGNIFDVLEDPGVKNPLEELALGDIMTKIQKAIAALPEKEKLVLSLYYDEDLNLKEIGQVMGHTESRICQLRTQAIMRLRSCLQDSVTSEFLDNLLSKRAS